MRPSRVETPEYRESLGTGEQVAEKGLQLFLQELKPFHSRSISPGPFDAQGKLKPRPPKEKEFSTGCYLGDEERAEAECFLGMPLGWQSRHLTK